MRRISILLFLLFLFPIIGISQTSGLEISKDEITTGGRNYRPSFFMTDYALNSKQVAKGKIKSISQFNYEAREKFGDIVKEKIFSSSPTFFYDTFGKITECKWTQGNDVLKRCLYIYNSEGNLIEINGYLFNKKLYKKTKFKLNSKGDVIEKNVYDSNGDLTEKHKFEYDEHRNLISDAEYKEYNMLAYLTIYTYNDNNLKLTEKFYDGNKKLIVTYIYEYNERNQIINYSFTEDYNFLNFRSYVYNKFGHIISITEHERINLGEYTLIPNEIDPIVNDNTPISENDSLTTEETVGIIIPENYRLRDFVKLYSFVTEYFKYVYDKKGNWISRTSFDQYDKPIEIIERKIEYYE